jgi:hypothetical protein
MAMIARDSTRVDLRRDATGRAQSPPQPHGMGCLYVYNGLETTIVRYLVLGSLIGVAAAAMSTTVQYPRSSVV